MKPRNVSRSDEARQGGDLHASGPHAVQLGLSLDGVKSDVSEDEAPFEGPLVREARRLGRLYWTLHPLCAMNGTVDRLDERLAACRAWAERRGVGDELDAALEAHRPEVV